MKWGIIATGRIARKFASTVNAMKEEGETLLAVASRSSEAAKKFGEEFSIPKCYGSYEELADDPEIDAVYIATPNNLHYENTLMCLEKGKHVLCEKPFTLKKEESEKLYKLAVEKKVFLMEAFWIALLPALQQMKKWIEDGDLGKVEFARVDYGFALTPERRYRKFAPELGGGALWDIGVYNLGFLRMVFGKNPVKVTSIIHLNEYGTDDFSTVELEYEDGAHAVAETSIGIDLGRKALIHGSKGLILLEDFQQAQTVSLVKFDGTTEKIDFPFEINGFEYQIRQCSAGVKEGRSFSQVYTPEASVDTIELIENIYRENSICFR